MIYSARVLVVVIILAMNIVDWGFGSSWGRLLSTDEKKLLSCIIQNSSLVALTMNELVRLSTVVRDRFCLAFMPQLLLRENDVNLLSLCFRSCVGHDLRDDLDILLFLLGNASEKYFDPMIFNHPEARENYKSLAQNFMGSYSKAISVLCGLEQRCDIQRDISSVLTSVLSVNCDEVQRRLDCIVPHKIAINSFLVSVPDERFGQEIDDALLRAYEIVLRYAGLNENSVDCLGNGLGSISCELLSAVLQEMKEYGLTVTGEIGLTRRCSVEKFLLEHGCATDEIRQRYVDQWINDGAPERFLQAVAGGESVVVADMLERMVRDSGFDNCYETLKSGLQQALLYGRKEIFNSIMDYMSGENRLILDQEMGAFRI